MTDSALFQIAFPITSTEVMEAQDILQSQEVLRSIDFVRWLYITLE
jgi:hypothetical protein